MTAAVAYRDVPGFPGYRVGDDGSVWPRYRAIGNSMAVPCIRWLGERIEMADALPDDLNSPP
jgi:site-specific DNA-cytosine methylase